MSSFSFNNAVPASGDNPSVDQPDMLLNNQSAFSIIDVDHIGYGQIPGGKHRQVRLQNLNLSPLPGGVANEGMLYVKTSSAVSNLWYRPDATSDQYQLTRTISASKTLFATNTNYQAGPPSLTGGWTFLPGGLLLQYGLANITTSNNTLVKFPISFTGTPFNVQVTGLRSNNGGDGAFVATGLVNSNNFTVANGSGSISQVYWMAIGI